MRAIWSFWSLPYRVHQRTRWFSHRHHLLSWVLSVETASRFFPETALYTDDEGAALLVDRLGLRFTEVSTALDDLNGQDGDWWVLGKLYTYRAQRQPFVHFDSDVYLWQAFPDRLLAAPIFAQNPEEAGDGANWYDPDGCERVIRERGHGWIPLEWNCYRSSGRPQIAACCGILGGNHVDALHQYASLVIEILQNPRNRAAFASGSDKRRHSVLFEQYLLCAFASYHEVPVEYLFHSRDDAFASAEAGGVTHLGGAKANSVVTQRLEQRVARDYPETYERCCLAGAA